MKHRIFIAINLPENIKSKLVEYQKKQDLLPVKWTKKDNLHITLVFLGYVSDEEILEICAITKEVASKHKPFLLNLTSISYGPPNKIPPRMVWTHGEKSPKFTALRDDLEKSLIVADNIAFSKEERVFSAHITLGRIKTWEWKTIEPEERPQVEKDISLNFEVNSIEVMESELKRGGPEYIILESCPMS